MPEFGFAGLLEAINICRLFIAPPWPRASAFRHLYGTGTASSTALQGGEQHQRFQQHQSEPNCRPKAQDLTVLEISPHGAKTLLVTVGKGSRISPSRTMPGIASTVACSSKPSKLNPERRGMPTEAVC